MSSVRKNLLYNTAYQIFSIIVPIVLAPLLSRRLGADGTGVYSFTYSITYYFMLFAMLGINNYGSRLIAKAKRNKNELNKKFWEIYSIQFILGIVMFLLFLLLVFFTSSQEYNTILLIQSIFVLSTIFDINWFFYGMEDFKMITVRSFIFKIINFILILLLVKGPEDVWIYALLMSTTTFLNQIVLWLFLFKHVEKPKISFNGMRRHIKPISALFIPVIAVSLYKIMDKIMLGSLSNVSEVGLYEYAEKINSIPLTMVMALGTVMLPHISSIFHDKIKVIHYFNKSAVFLLFSTTPIPLLFLLIMPTIIPFYLGPGFDKAVPMSIMLSFTLPFVSFANVIRTQYLIPKEEDRKYIVSVLIGAILNLICNFVLIPRFGGYGACIGTLISEISVMLFQSFSIKDEVSIWFYVIKIVSLFGKSLFAFFVVLSLKYVDMNNIVRIMLQTFFYIIIYLSLNMKYICDKSNFKIRRRIK